MNAMQDFPDHRYRQMVELSLDSIKEISLDGRVVFVNSHGLARVAAHNADAVIGKQWASLWPEEFRPRIEEALAAAARGESQRFEAECTTDDGHRHFWLVSTNPLRAADGHVEAVLAVNRDITERRQSQQALRTLNDSLRTQPELLGPQSELADAIDQELQSYRNASAPEIEGELDIARAAQRLAEAVAERAQEGEAVGQLLAGVVHDLNNVLQTAGAAIEMVQTRASVIGQDKQLLGMAQGALQKGSIMAQRLLGFARHHPYAPECIDLGDLAERLMPLLQQAAGSTVAVELHQEASQRFVLADAHSLERALLNLVINARDACAESGHIRITLGNQTTSDATDADDRAAGEYVTLAVQDTGKGIAPDVRDRLFDAYFTTKPVGKGTGLGLAQVDGAVRQAGGFIDVESEPGQGARFILGFPAADTQCRPGDTASAPGQQTD
ncbi:PAS domain-containing protein [Xanthomonas campestris pv. raphani]|nr:PAS domain-containing protein [Xanthomonas campestris pv. raphani]WDJ24645.1 PAS domain-containing protein [Xanthomonas campestris pv. raphani]